MTAIVRPSEALRPAAPELRAALRSEAFWREHAARFLAAAAHLANDDADAAAAVVLAATASILSGERACPTVGARCDSF